MKLFLALLMLVGAYLFTMMKTTDIVLGQTQTLQSNYQYFANHSDELATGRKLIEQ